MPAELILSEHVRLNSNMVILSRSFKNYKERFEDIKISVDLYHEVKKLRKYVEYLKTLPRSKLLRNQKLLKNKVKEIVLLKVPK